MNGQPPTEDQDTPTTVGFNNTALPNNLTIYNVEDQPGRQDGSFSIYSPVKEVPIFNYIYL